MVSTEGGLYRLLRHTSFHSYNLHFLCVHHKNTHLSFKILDYNMDLLQWEDIGYQTGFSCTFRMSSAILIAYLDTSTERDAAMKTQQF